MEESKYVEIRYKMLRTDFNEYKEVAENDCWISSPTSLIKAFSEREAKLLKEKRLTNENKIEN